MVPRLDWASWFAVALPVSAVSIFLIWIMLLFSYQPARSPDGEGYIEIKAIRPTKEPFTNKQYWVSFVCLVTIALWCVAHSIDEYVGDMGVIAIIPIVAFFSTGVLKKVSLVVGDCWDVAYLIIGVCRVISISSCGRSYFSLWEASLWVRAWRRVVCWA